MRKGVSVPEYRKREELEQHPSFPEKKGKGPRKSHKYYRGLGKELEK